MLAKVLKRGFHSASPNVKFPAGTVAGSYKSAVAEKPEYDAVRFHNQRYNWSLQEFDRYSSAFAFGLLEAGFSKGDSLVFAGDQTCAAESLVAQLGAIKAGVRIVTVSEKDSADALDHAIGSTQAKGLLFEPSNPVKTDGTTRLDMVHSLMPELKTMYAGDELSVAKYPHLHHVVQTKFKAIRGVNMFKDLAVYANPSMSTHEIPANSADDEAYCVVADGKTTSYSSGELAEKAQDLWSNTLSASAGAEGPVFLSCDLETPLGFASFLACSTNFKKVFVPGTFNMSQLLKTIPMQKSSFLVCDKEFYQLEAPPKGDYVEMCSQIENVLVSGSQAGKSQLFAKAKASAFDPSSF